MKKLTYYCDGKRGTCLKKLNDTDVLDSPSNYTFHVLEVPLDHRNTLETTFELHLCDECIKAWLVETWKWETEIRNLIKAQSTPKGPMNKITVEIVGQDIFTFHTTEPIEYSNDVDGAITVTAQPAKE